MYALHTGVAAARATLASSVEEGEVLLLLSLDARVDRARVVPLLPAPLHVVISIDIGQLSDSYPNVYPTVVPIPQSGKGVLGYPQTPIY